jgi:hypothetical protein
MKAEWRRPGRATGTLICRLSLPEIDLNIDRRAQGDRAVGAIRRFLRQQIPESPEAQIGGSFVINMEFRAKNMSVRWLPLCRWRAGEAFDAAIDRAAKKWQAVEKEVWPGSYEQRIGVVPRRRARR